MKVDVKPSAGVEAVSMFDSLLLLQVRGKCSTSRWEAVCSTAKFTRTALASYTTTAPPAPARYRPGSQTPPSLQHEEPNVYSKTRFIIIKCLLLGVLLLPRIPQWCARSGALGREAVKATSAAKSVCPT